MIITRQVVRDALLDYLNRQTTLAQLVDWAETTFIDADLQPEEDIDLLNHILSYLAAADTIQFPLTWEICADFLHELGTVVRVVEVA